MFSIGIVGLPNVGKSTLFAALTEAQVDCANYPFCTIEPNKAIVPVPDQRLQKIGEIESSEKILPTTIEFVDIAGLVAGAHKGEGLGNQFLTNIREVDAIVHLIRGFEDSNITHVSGKVDPKSDKETILMELILADIQHLENRVENMRKKAKTDKLLAAKTEVFEKLKTGLEKEQLAKDIELNEKEQDLISDLHLLTSKPILTVINGPQTTEDELIHIDVKEEYEISKLAHEERDEMRKALGIAESGLGKIINKSYEVLGLITFITAGPKETRAWTIKKGARAPQAAGKIHTDFEKGFIKAETIGWEKLSEAGGWSQARAKGWVRQEGKEYVVQDGDVMLFKFNV